MKFLRDNKSSGGRYQRGNDRSQVPEQEQEEGGTRALVLLGAAVTAFVFAVVMCLVLINKSAETTPLPTVETQIKPITYQVNVPPTAPVEQDQNDPIQIDLKAPVSVNDSSIINILLLGVEGDKNDTIIIASVDMLERSVAFLSVPRDTYIAGDYELPKANQIYGAFEEERRVEAVKEAVKGMFGFWVDYYFVLDEQTLSQMVLLADGVPFEVPDEPAYHSLKSGRQTIGTDNAFDLFRFKASWEDVETDPPRVQRYFLQALFSRLLENKETISENCLAISQIAQTDLTLGEIAYLAYLLVDFDFDDAYSRALPGGEVEVDEVSYYQVDPEDAVDMLNEHFNPLDKDLTVYNVNFRQQQDPSGEGEYSDYGHSSSTTTGEEGSSEDAEPSEDETTESTENTEESGTTEASETTESTEATDSEPEPDPEPEE